MIANISDCKYASFLSIEKVKFNEIDFFEKDFCSQRQSSFVVSSNNMFHAGFGDVEEKSYLCEAN